jgi:hypothetical protein
LLFTSNIETGIRGFLAYKFVDWNAKGMELAKIFRPTRENSPELKPYR